METFEVTTGADMQGREFLLLDRQQVINIIENMLDAVVVLSPDATIWYANKTLVAMTGWSVSELNGSPLGKIVPDDEFSLFIMLQQMITKGPIRGYETCLLSRNMEKIPVSFNGSVLRDGSGRMIGLVGVARDDREIKTLIMKLEEANITLEHKVRQRTAELEKAYNELKNKESQLIQSEKMASLGQLAAGVAHEINNPMSFINSNLGTLEQYVKDFIGLARINRDMVELADRQKPEEIRDIIKAMHNYLNEYDIDFVSEDVIKVIRESREGAERVKKIVQDLKEFSHVDKAEKTHFNVNQGLDSTLNIVMNEIKYRAEVVKDYGDVPEILCYPMELNQVFMNLLVNASHAIEKTGTITVRTSADSENVYVEVADTGCGIPEGIKNRIFEPFFTTKEVGKGTGLGLSISYGIIKKHNGDISLTSKAGEGTTFKLKIPI